MNTHPPLRLLRIVLITVLMAYAIMTVVPEEGQQSVQMPSNAARQTQPVAVNGVTQAGVGH